MLSTRVVKVILGVAIVLNLAYFTHIYSNEEAKLRQLALKHATFQNYQADDQVEIPKNKPYSEYTPEQKVAELLHKVEQDKDTYWLAQTEVTEPDLVIQPKDFLPGEEDRKTWVNRPEMFYDPRFTLALYLDEIKHQLVTKNPKNEKAKDVEITVPFAWSDWMDLTMLNEELAKPQEERVDCGWLQSKINKATKYPRFCSNLRDITDADAQKLGLPSKDFLPGFVVHGSPMNKAPHKQVMMQGKAFMLASQENPMSIIFLTKDGTYEAQVLEKKRIVHTDMFERYLDRKNINANHLDDIGNSLVINCQEEYRQLLTTVPPRPLDLGDDIYRMNSIARNKDVNASREIFLEPEAFNYREDKVNQQIKQYEARLNKMELAMTSELHYDPAVLAENRLTRHERNHYDGLKMASITPVDNEPTYYKLATLLKDQDNKDPGWHNEWRFFNGALRYVREGYTTQDLEIREQIILDRLIRNWFRFAEEKGIISWIAHGPLLSWYWDGLMFPFDIDVDIQMPSSELNRLLKNYNMTLVVEDISEGYGRYLIDCSTFIHHRDRPQKDNHIDARFIDIDTGTYIDITGVGRNNEQPPPEYETYIRNKNSKGEEVELYMDRRKHWLSFEQISPLRYSMLGGVPVYVPNDIMSMLNYEYSKGTTAYHFNGYYFVPQVRLWVLENHLTPLFDENLYKDGDKVNPDKLVELVTQMTIEDKVRLLELNQDVLMEYYLTHKYTMYHDMEKKFMLDHSLQHLILELKDNKNYHRLTSKFNMGKPLRKCLYDFEFIERLKHKEQ